MNFALTVNTEKCLAGALFMAALLSGYSAAAEPKNTAAEPKNTAAELESAVAVDIPSGAYGLDKTHGYVTFSYSHLGFSNPEVGFNDVDVDLQLDADNLQNSSLRVVIAAASVDSRVAEFDKHLKGADYFDVMAHPEIRFESTTLEMTSAVTANIAGELTIKGVTKPVTLTAVLNKAGMHPLKRLPALGVSATAQIKRSDWGLSKYVPMVSDNVTLRIEVELPKVSGEKE